ncbi:hypothetical protein NMG60_11030766 [Bertholletia excelsa]
MAEPSTSAATGEPNPQPSEVNIPPTQSNQSDPSPPPSSSSSTPPVNTNPASILAPPQIQPYAPPAQVPPPTAPSFRPATPPVPIPSAPQFSPLPSFPSSGVQSPSVPPPGVSGVASGPPLMQSYAAPGQPPNTVLRHYAPMPNGYPAIPPPQGTIPPPGIPRYPSPFTPMVRPTFPPRPPGAIGIVPPLPRPPVPGIRGPIIPPVVRPAVVPSITPAETPQTTVYVGKIASTIENDFILSLLQLCGPVKNWKRAQVPTNGAHKGFGFCDFETAEGVLRALRLLNKLNVDGQELMINVTEATKKYLKQYVEKKAANSKKVEESETDTAKKEEDATLSAEKSERPKPSAEESKKDDSGNEENNDNSTFGIVTDEDREADREALEKLKGMIEERLKNKPLPPPPPPPAADGTVNSNSEQPARSKDGDSEADARDGEEKNDDEMTSDSKATSEHDKPETGSPDRVRRYDRKGRDRERDMKREKERELERYEREREQDRARREREREYKIKEDERRYKARVKEWESREREKEYLRKLEKEKEKEREYKRKREIMDQENETDDGESKRRKHRSSGSDERKRRVREKEDDIADRLKEEEEAAEAKRRAEEELLQLKQEKDAPDSLPGDATNESDVVMDEATAGSKEKAVEETYDGDSVHGNSNGSILLQNGNGEESVTGSLAASDVRQNSNIPARKLGFGLVGSGKRTAVPSFFNEEEDEDSQKEKKMRPLVPIDYSTEELQAVQPTAPGAPSPNLAAAAEFAKRISGTTPKEERPDAEKERSRRSHDRSSQRDRDRNDDEAIRTRDEGKKENLERDRGEQGVGKAKAPDNQKLLDAKQLIDMIPKTKDELFSYEINWAIYDRNELHDRMRPWISKKITEFLGEEEASLVEYIVSSMREHVKASEMLERLSAILDDEAEMFVLKMWRMLIFEIKKIETGLAMRPKA